MTETKWNDIQSSVKTSVKPWERVQNQYLKPRKKWQKPQVTSEQLKKWRDRKREAKKIMDQLMKMSNLSFADFMVKYFIVPDIKYPDRYVINPNLSVQDVILANYIKTVLNWALMVDWLNRHVSYAPSKNEITGDDGDDIKIEATSAQEEKIDKILSALQNLD